MFKWLAPQIALLIFIAQPATALVFDRIPFIYEGKTVYEWHGSICERDELPGNDDQHLMIRIYTSGGYLTNLPVLKSSLEQTARDHLSRTGQPATVVFGQCGSACIRLLAHANQLARAGVIDLQVERGETVGFHGVSVGGVYNSKGTLESIRDLINEGMSVQWLRKHASYFELYANTIQTLEYESPELRGSGLIDAARIVDASEYHEMRSHTSPTDSLNTASGSCPKDSGEL